MSIKTPRLIQDRCGVYYFRLIVPLSWRHIVKKTEIRRSLRTKDAATARQAALVLSARMEVFVAKSKSNFKPKSFSELSAEGRAMLEKLKRDLDDDLIASLEPKKALVRIFNKPGIGDVHIETDTLEELREARALVAEYAKLGSASIGQAMVALPLLTGGPPAESLQFFSFHKGRRPCEGHASR